MPPIDLALARPRLRARRAGPVLDLAQSDGRRGRRAPGDASWARGFTGAPAVRTPRSSRSRRAGRARARRRSLPDPRAVRPRGPHASVRAGRRRVGSEARRRRRDGSESEGLGPRRGPPCGAPESRSSRAPGPWRRWAPEQNERFRAWVSTGRPFVLAKWAETLDGKTAEASGKSRWITGETARRRAMLWREEYDAVLVGAGTVLADDPRLTRRLGRNRSTEHWRIVLDGRLRVPETREGLPRARPPRRRDRAPAWRTRRSRASGRAASRSGACPEARRAGWTCARFSPSSAHGR